MKKIIFVLCLFGSQLSAIEWRGSLTAESGYRFEYLSNTIESKRTDGSIAFVDKLTLNNISVFQNNLSGSLYINNYLQVNAKAGYSQVVGGRYAERISQYDSIETRAKINNGYGRDAFIDIAYLCPLNCYFWFGPDLGLFYQDLRVSLSSVEEDGSPTPELNGVSFTNLWRGARFGLLGTFNMRGICVSANYYLYLPVWRAKWQLPGPDIYGDVFSDYRKATSGFGQSIGMNVDMKCIQCWRVGIGLNYQYLYGYGGVAVPQSGSFASVGLDSVFRDTIRSVYWHNVEALCYLQRNF